MVDFDRVSLSSLNRHAVATRKDVGTPKVVACSQHFQKILPGCHVDARDEMYTAETADSLLGGAGRARCERPQLVVDCIDDVGTKADLLAYCVGHGIPVISALGSGAKSDPAQLCVAKGLRDIENDPLATKLRKLFSTREVDMSGVSFVYSSQKPQRALLPLSEEQRQKPEEYGNVANFRLRVIPVLGTQPAIAGVALACQALLELGLGRSYQPRPSPAPRRALVERYLEQLRKRERGGDVDITVSEASYLVHEVWKGRSALNTDVAVSGASGSRFTLARWDNTRGATPDNLLLVTEEEANNHATGRGTNTVPDDTARRVHEMLKETNAALALPSLEVLQMEGQAKVGGIRPHAVAAGRWRINSLADAKGMAELLQPWVIAGRGGTAAGTTRIRSAFGDEEEAALVEEQLSRSSAFLGPEGHGRVRSAFVVVVGAGAVGSAAAALLVRAGIRRLRLVDGAALAHAGSHGLATAADVGLPKAEACRRALEDILPDCHIEAVACRFDSVTARDLLDVGNVEGPPNLLLDCTGDLTTKADVLGAASAHGVPAVTVMACKGIADPTRLVVTPLAQVYASPSVVALRMQLARKGVAAAEIEKLDCVHSQEANHWMAQGMCDSAGPQVLSPHWLGLAAAAVALHRLSGEELPLSAAPGALSVWKRMRRALAQREGLDPHSTALPDVHAAGCVAEHVWRGRSALSRASGDGLVLARWDHSRPLDLWNLVLVTEEEGLQHTRASADTGSLPRPLLEALGRGRSAATAGGAPAALLEQQLRAHHLLRRLRQHLEAAGRAAAVGGPLDPRRRSAPRPAPREAGVEGSRQQGAAAMLVTLAVLGGGLLTAVLPQLQVRALGDGLWRHTRRLLRRSHRLLSPDCVFGASFGAVACAFGQQHWWTPPQLTAESRAEAVLRAPGPAPPAPVAPQAPASIAPQAAGLRRSVSLGQMLQRVASGACTPLRAALAPPRAGAAGGSFGALVGGTPLVELRSLSEATGCRVLAKAEFLSPGGCQKDRVARQILEEAEASGCLRPGGTIVEGTSGSTGISLCLAAAARGYRVHIVMPDDQAAEKVQLLRRFGAEVELVRPASIANPAHFVNVARRRADELRDQPGSPGAVFADQFENPANFNAHYHGTGPELWAQCGGRLDAFVMSAGTGGTIAGVARFLKDVKSEARVILADVQGSSLYNKVARGVLYASEQAERSVRRHRTDTIAEGIGLDRLTANFARGLPAHNGGLPGVDEAVRVSDQEALDMAHYLLAHEGLFVGSSAAVNCAAAVKVARQLESGSCVATVLCDGGQRHLTKFYNPVAWPEFGLKPPLPRERSDLSFIR